MTRRSLPIAHRLIRATLRAAFLLVVLVMAASQSGTAQAEPYERTYFQSKGAVERALKELQPSMVDGCRYWKDSLCLAIIP